MERIKKGKREDTWAHELSVPFLFCASGISQPSWIVLENIPILHWKYFDIVYEKTTPLCLFDGFQFYCLFVCPFHYQGFSLFTLECSLHICLVACHDHRHVCTPRLHHLLHCSHPHKCHPLPTTFQITSSDATKTHQISEMAHCFKGLWIILNDWF